MAQTKSTGARRAKKLDSGAKATAAEQNAADAKPPRRRISRRKVVDNHIRSYFDALGRRDIRALGEHWSDEGVADIVPLGVLRGRDEIIGLFRELFAAVPDLETTVTRVVAGEQQAVVEWRASGHFTGQALQGVEPTATRVEWRGIDLIEVADGKNACVTAYYDGMSFARQIGLMPTQGSASERAMKGALNAATKLRRTVTTRSSGR
jgi:ketosteroid isomerase-like protein